jgi:hypothetical protein
MRTRLALVAGVALIAIGAAFAAASGQTAQKAATSMVVYKSQT